MQYNCIWIFFSSLSRRCWVSLTVLCGEGSLLNVYYKRKTCSRKKLKVNQSIGRHKTFSLSLRITYSKWLPSYISCKTFFKTKEINIYEISPLLLLLTFEVSETMDALRKEWLLSLSSLSLADHFTWLYNCELTFFFLFLSLRSLLCPLFLSSCVWE